MSCKYVLLNQEIRKGYGEDLCMLPLNCMQLFIFIIVVIQQLDKTTIGLRVLQHIIVGCYLQWPIKCIIK